MLTDLLQIFEAGPAEVIGYPQLPEAIVEVEVTIAGACVADLPVEEARVEALHQALLVPRAFELSLAAALLRIGYPYRRSVLRIIKNKMVKPPPAETLAQEILDLYQVDAKFDEYIHSTVQAVDALIQLKPERAAFDIPKTSWALAKTRLAMRSIFLGLVGRWDEDHCNEPILWKSRDRLTEIARTRSETALTDTFYRLLLVGYQTQASQQRDTLKDFLIQANDEKNKLLIDNLVLSQQTYASLLGSGWQPDRWELENLPMTIELFLDYMQTVGCIQEKTVGEEFVLSLEDALKQYRYSGTPFIENTDTKKVRVIAPGWFYQGELIIQPKVREIS